MTVKLITFQCYATNNYTANMLPYKYPKWRRNDSQPCNISMCNPFIAYSKAYAYTDENCVRQ